MQKYMEFYYGLIQQESKENMAGFCYVCDANF